MAPTVKRVSYIKRQTEHQMVRRIVSETKRTSNTVVIGSLNWSKKESRKI
jgi:hypothetical protein